MVYVSQKVCCTTLQSHATKKIIPSYIKKFTKQLLKNTTQTIKIVLPFQPTKMIPNVLPNIGSLKQSSLTQNHGESKGDIIPKIPLPEDVTCD